MATFVCNLSHTDQTHRLIATCTIVGAEHGYHTHQREFDNESQAAKALADAGIDANRVGPIPENAAQDWSRTFKISHNEAQKLDVLRVDSTE